MGKRGGFIAQNTGGRREGAGRKKGKRNKKTAALIAKAEAGGIMPLDVMLKQMRLADAQADELRKSEDPDAKAIREAEDIAFERAKDAAPYLHARLSSITKKEEPIDITKLPREILERALELDEAIDRARQGKTTH